jgi:hypothetical protein
MASCMSNDMVNSEIVQNDLPNVLCTNLHMVFKFYTVRTNEIVNPKILSSTWWENIWNLKVLSLYGQISTNLDAFTFSV